MKSLAGRDILSVEGQIGAPVHIGLGFALTEGSAVEGVAPSTKALKSPGIVPPTRVPEVETILVEVPQPGGPHGAGSVGASAREGSSP